MFQTHSPLSWFLGKKNSFIHQSQIRKHQLIQSSQGRDQSLAMSKRLPEDWTRAAEEGSKVLMNLRIGF